VRIRYLDRRFEPLAWEASSGYQDVPSFGLGFLLSPYLLEGLGLGEWLGIVGLALAGVAFAVVAFNVLKSRQGRIAKAFLLDSAGTPLKELVFDPRCPITLSEAQDHLPDRGLSDEAETETSGYRLTSLHADNLRLILAFRGRVPLEGPSFAKFLMVSVQDRFDEALVTRAAQVADSEQVATQREAALQEGEGRLAPQQEAIEKETAILNERARKLSEQKEYFDGKMAEVRRLGEHLQTSASEVGLERDRLEKWVEELGTREERVRQVESDSDRRLATLNERESRLVGREQEIDERERKAVASEVTSRSLAEDAEAKVLDVRKREENLAVREQSVAHGRTQLDRALAELAQRTETFRATESTRIAALDQREASVSASETDLRKRKETFERDSAMKQADIDQWKREIKDRDENVSNREAAAQALAEETEAKVQEVRQRHDDLARREENLARGRAELDRAVADLAARTEAFHGSEAAHVAALDQRESSLAAGDTDLRNRRATFEHHSAT